MAITQSALAGGFSFGNVNTTTASITPGSNRLITATVWNHRSGGAAADLPTCAGCSLTWVEVATLQISTDRRMTVFRAMGGSPSTGVLTFTFANTPGWVEWSVSEWNGVATGGTNGSEAIGAIDSDTGTDTVTVTLPTFSGADNRLFAVGHGSTAIELDLLESPGGSSATIIRDSRDGTAPAYTLVSGWIDVAGVVGVTTTIPGLTGETVGSIAIELNTVSTPAAILGTGSYGTPSLPRPDRFYAVRQVPEITWVDVEPLHGAGQVTQALGGVLQAPGTGRVTQTLGGILHLPPASRVTQVNAGIIWIPGPDTPPEPEPPAVESACPPPIPAPVQGQNACPSPLPG